MNLDQAIQTHEQEQLTIKAQIHDLQQRLRDVDIILLSLSKSKEMMEKDKTGEE